MLGVNSPAQLAELERRCSAASADALMEAGVRLADPARFDLRGELVCGSDVEIDVDCVFEGRVVLGDGVRIGANCVIRNATIGAGAVIHPFTHIDGDAARREDRRAARWSARSRGCAPAPSSAPRCTSATSSRSRTRRSPTAPRPTTSPTSATRTVGERVNYGAGSITANYDGANKHRTVIGDDVHVGRNCVLVAPVTIGDGATIGGGSTISKDAPAGQLTVARARQVTLDGWKRPSQEEVGRSAASSARSRASRPRRLPCDHPAARTPSPAIGALIHDALQLVAAELAAGSALRLGLDALGDHRDAQAAAPSG